ncbi:MAG: winged helix-turn-helix domain-containing protein [Iodobacter sp.]
MKIYYIAGTVVFDFKNEKLITEKLDVSLRHNEALFLNLLLNGIEMKEDLISKVWSNGATSESSYYKLVHDLRRSLDSVGLPDVIKTIPRKGFRFVGGFVEINDIAEVFPSRGAAAEQQDGEALSEVNSAFDSSLAVHIEPGDLERDIKESVFNSEVNAGEKNKVFEETIEFDSKLTSLPVSTYKKQNIMYKRWANTTVYLYSVCLFFFAVAPYYFAKKMTDTGKMTFEHKNGVRWVHIGGKEISKINIGKDAGSVYIRNSQTGQTIYICNKLKAYDSCESYYFLR